MQNQSSANLPQRKRTLFVEREISLCSGGQARTIKLSARKQAIIASVALFAVLAWALSFVALAMGRNEMLARQAEVRNEATRVAALRNDLGGVAEDLQRRQAFLEEMVELLPADVTDDDAERAEAPEAGLPAKLSAATPEAAALARLEQRQLTMVERLTRFAQTRAAKAEAAIRKLGLDPRAVIADARVGQGGPLELLASGDGAFDPHFAQLGQSLARMNELERALARIPQVMPADGRMISSSYGLRRDPFTGEAAMHSGLDFRGATGAPIHAAAKGRISFVGVKGGYGNVVEISHGNGLMTRYAHMSGFDARLGQEVAAGDVIGRIGSTGRSTGPHLHFEVRVYDRAVNPRPFLENAPELLQQVRLSEG